MHKSSPDIKIGIIGSGDVVKKSYLPALIERSDCRIVGICGLGEKNALELARNYKIETVFQSYEELLGCKGINTVLICTPTYTHKIIAETAINKEKNILVEKPICGNYNDSYNLIQLARNYQKTFFVSSNNLYRRENSSLRDRIVSGGLGNIEFIDLEWYRERTALNKYWLYNKTLSGGGVLLDLGTHLIQYALSLIPERQIFRTTCCLKIHKISNDFVEDTASGAIIIDEKYTILFKLAWDMPPGNKTKVNIEVLCEKGIASNRDYIGEKANPFNSMLDEFFAHINRQTKPDLSLIDDTMMIIDHLYQFNNSKKAMTGKFNRKILFN